MSLLSKIVLDKYCCRLAEVAVKQSWYLYCTIQHESCEVLK